MENQSSPISVCVMEKRFNQHGEENTRLMVHLIYNEREDVALIGQVELGPEAWERLKGILPQFAQVRDCSGGPGTPPVLMPSD
jgi:hypothetical protein